MDAHHAPDAEVPRPVRDAIVALARQHSVAYQPSPLDSFALDTTRLADTEVVPDAVEDLGPR